MPVNQREFEFTPGGSTSHSRQSSNTRPIHYNHHIPTEETPLNPSIPEYSPSYADLGSPKRDSPSEMKSTFVFDDQRDQGQHL